MESEIYWKNVSEILRFLAIFAIFSLFLLNFRDLSDVYRFFLEIFWFFPNFLILPIFPLADFSNLPTNYNSFFPNFKFKFSMTFKKNPTPCKNSSPTAFHHCSQIKNSARTKDTKILLFFIWKITQKMYQCYRFFRAFLFFSYFFLYFIVLWQNVLEVIFVLLNITSKTAISQILEKAGGQITWVNIDLSDNALFWLDLMMEKQIFHHKKQ